MVGEKKIQHKSVNMLLFTRREEVYIVLCNGHNGRINITPFLPPTTIFTIDHRPPVARTRDVLHTQKRKKNNNMESD